MSKEQNSSEALSVTADDVAKLAGVSRWTVNRAFKKDASISEKSREKVKRAAAELGYLPDLLAASLSSDKSHLVALLIDDFANPHKLAVLEVLTKTLRAHGWDSLLVSTSGEEDATNALMGASQRRVDAAVMIGSGFNDETLNTALKSRRVRKLIIFLRESPLDNTLSICVDDKIAMGVVVDYVLQKGYRSPYFLAGPQTSSAHLSRKETFLTQWFEATGQTVAFSSVASYDYQLAYDHIQSHFADVGTADLPDVIVCENDALAMGTIDAIRYKLGLRVPEDIAVTGFDDVPQAAGPHYDLTTYKQPLDEMANALINLLKGEKGKTDQASSDQTTRFCGKLVVRTSA
ncbi:MAG: LacI family DNA-binding transcriptional regulator [Pontibacterium sp.]